MNRLDGKVALITGGGSGIGAATAELFAEAGAKVMICGRRIEPLEQVVEQIAAKGGIAECRSCDISDEAAVEALVEDTVKTHGGLHVLVNNAVVMVPGMVDGHSSKAWHANFSVNLDGAFYCTRAAFDKMKVGGGSIVNIASVCGMLATPGTAGYSAAKAALIQFTRNVAIEGAPHGIRANVMPLGVFLTPPTEQVLPSEGAQQATAKSVPLGRIGDPMEAAHVALFFASDASSYVTGTVLPVDGGRTCELGTGAASFGD